MVGPYCTMMLGDLGADVLESRYRAVATTRAHWEPPFVDTESVYYLSVNRNKRSIALDPQAGRRQGGPQRLISATGRLVENFPPVRSIGSASATRR